MRGQPVRGVLCPGRPDGCLRRRRPGRSADTWVARGVALWLLRWCDDRVALFGGLPEAGPKDPAVPPQAAGPDHAPQPVGAYPPVPGPYGAGARGFLMPHNACQRLAEALLTG